MPRRVMDPLWHGIIPDLLLCTVLSAINRGQSIDRTDGNSHSLHDRNHKMLTTIRMDYY